MEEAMAEMDCTDITRLLAGLVDDELDADTRRRAERHLASCRACRALLDRHEAVDLQLRSMWTQSPAYSTVPAGLHARVLAATSRAQAPTRRGWFGALGWIVAAASLAFAATAWRASDRTGSRSDLAPGAGVTRASSALPSTWEPGADAWAGVLSASDAAAHGAVVMPNASGSSRNGSDANTSSGASAGGPAPNGAGLEDADALFAASLLLSRLARTDLPDDEAVARIRSIAEYDGILARLAAAREHLRADDRVAVRQAETILAEVLAEPSAHDLSILRDRAAREHLAALLDDLSQRIESELAL
ncbi:MAG: zf-HC2 domain-containing protein [Phycisphaerales bacterium]|nr:zf-HC2 domain-containing protein [Phycisphaerales bacterium]